MVGIDAVRATADNSNKLLVGAARRLVQLSDRLRSDRGAVISEYALLLFMIAIAAVGILVLLGGELVELFTGAESDFDARPPLPTEAD